MTAIISISASIFSFFESLQGMDLMSVCKQLARQFYNNNVLKVSIHVFPSQCLRRPPAHPPTPPAADWAGPAGLGWSCVHRAGKRPLQLQPSSHGRLLRKRNRQRSDKLASLRSTMKDRQG